MSVDLDAGLGLDETPAEPAETPRTNFYPHVFAFVADFLVDIYAREVHDQRRDFRWCARWFEHTEALARLEAVWKAWEALRVDPGTGAGVWFREFLDPAMAALTASDGPFSRCNTTTHKPPPPLPTAEPPLALLQR